MNTTESLQILKNNLVFPILMIHFPVFLIHFFDICNHSLIFMNDLFEY